MRPEADPDPAGRGLAGPDVAGRCLGPLVSQGKVPSLAYAVLDALS